MVPRLKVKDDTVTTINVQHRVLKYDVIKNYICEIMGVGGGGERGDFGRTTFKRPTCQKLAFQGTLSLRC